MNLNNLFEIQDKLDKYIVKEKGLEGQDLLDKKILALQVELGELANEHKGFKFWSTNQEPRDSVFSNCDDEEAEYFFCGECHREFSIEDAENWDYECNECFNTLMGMKERNPLLEEYVDVLHFILSIGLELEGERLYATTRGRENPTTLTDVFNSLFEIAAEVRYSTKNRHLTAHGIKVAVNNYEVLLGVFTQLGEMLGFTREQIEDAYMQKNEINHARQKNGY